jgi:hypothetical protein
MKNYECWEIGGHSLEFLDESHQYLIDGVCVPSITQIMKIKFGGKYEGIDKETLKRASEAGTQMHETIQKWCEKGIDSDLVELHNFKFLKAQYGFEVIENETPVILSYDNEPMCAGRLDMVIMLRDQIGLADLKRTSSLDKEYLAYQLNLYRIAYRQTYGIEADFLRGIHLREDIRKFVPIPVNEPMTWEFLKEYKESAHEKD